MLALLIAGLGVAAACRRQIALEGRRGHDAGAFRVALLAAAGWAAAGLAASALGTLLGSALAGAVAAAPCLVLALGALRPLLRRRGAAGG
jgi:hypothetical protein